MKAFGGMELMAIKPNYQKTPGYIRDLIKDLNLKYNEIHDFAILNFESQSESSNSLFNEIIMEIPKENAIIIPNISIMLEDIHLRPASIVIILSDVFHSSQDLESDTNGEYRGIDVKLGTTIKTFDELMQCNYSLKVDTLIHYLMNATDDNSMIINKMQLINCLSVSQSNTFTKFERTTRSWKNLLFIIFKMKKLCVCNTYVCLNVHVVYNRNKVYTYIIC